MTRLRHSAPLALLLAPLPPLLLLLLASPTSVSALEVTPGSDCAAYCLDDSDGDSFDRDDSNTNTTDIVCEDVDFTTKSRGIKFKNCQECLQKSGHVNGTESDMHWYLYNLKYTISSCLFGKPNEVDNPINSPCIIDYACLPIGNALEKGLNSSSDKTWDYCDETKGQFTEAKLESCVSCLRASSDQTYLGNFVVALGAGCDQRPELGSTIGLTDTVFTSDTINGTEPAEDIRSRPAGAGSNTLTTGAIVGIAVGAGLLLLGGLALFCVYWRKQKKYEATEKQGGDFFGAGGSGGGIDGGGGGGGVMGRGGSGTYTPDPFLPPEGNQMTSSLRHMSGGGGGGGGDAGGFYGGQGHMKGMSVSSAEYYDKLEADGQHSNYNFDPRSSNRGPNGALPSHPAYIPRAASRLAQESRSTPTPPPHQQESQAAHHHPPPPPPPPPSASRHAGSKSESYAMHKYTSSTSSLRGTSSTRSTPKSSPQNPPPPPPPPPPQKHKVPSLVLPSLGRVRGPKKYSPPLVNSRSETPSSMEREREEASSQQSSLSAGDWPTTAMHISRPVVGGGVAAGEAGARFQDKPLQGGQVLSTESGPAVTDRHGRNNSEWSEVPMKSGKSALYGY